ncbi:MAG: GNAT family N-acetyltransferase [Bacteroidia bacterium]|nr:GNAT family N-acetyltransferase [Bacteroidia bacterium]
MPKHVQYTKDSIVNASIETLRAEGIGALTARAISKRMGCSVAPLFRTFSNMDDLMDSVRQKAEDIFRGYMEDSVRYSPAFKEFGIRLIRFSKEEPDLFHFLFLEKDRHSGVADVIAGECLKQTAMDFGLTEEQTEFVYGQIWPFACGLAQLSRNNIEQYTEEHVSQLLSTQFTALISLVKSGRDVVAVEPHLIPEGEHVCLRRWRESDAADLYRLASDPDVGPRAGWPPHKSIEESREIIRTVFRGERMWAIILKENGELIGCAGYLPASCSNLDITDDQCEVGYWIGKPYWNKGYCTEALRVVMDYCFNVKGFAVLWGDYFPENPASGRVMEKCGFVDTGRQVLCPNLEVGCDKPVKVLRISREMAVRGI